MSSRASCGLIEPCRRQALAKPPLAWSTAKRRLSQLKLACPRHATAVNTIDNEAERRLDLDLLEERREIARIKEAKYKTQLERYYNARVRICTFTPGEYVFRDNEASNVERPGKLAPKWEGPYLVHEVLGKGA
ncbi:hypothetical protein HanIR_Chr15g0781171 [Helianthus annuus]|nr:hypothetical protein HanIR_Chr15g0781171 [Helianthus annuus]